MDLIYQEALRLIDAGEPFTLVTITESDGSTPRKVGVKMIVLETGEVIGTIGGGPLEFKAAELAVKTLKEGGCHKIKFELAELMLSCGGSVEVFFEPHASLRRAVIFGGGHIASRLAPLLRTIDFRVCIVEDRKEYLASDNFLDCDKILTDGYVAEDLEKCSPKINLKPDDYAVIITRGHEFSDGKVLDYIMSMPFELAYVGMIGSRNKVSECMKTLMEKGYPAERLKKVFAPVGLDIGGETPAEIAVAVAAQILCVKYSKDGKNVRDAKGFFNN